VRHLKSPLLDTNISVLKRRGVQGGPLCQRLVLACFCSELRAACLDHLEELAALQTVLVVDRSDLSLYFANAGLILRLVFQKASVPLPDVACGSVIGRRVEQQVQGAAATQIVPQLGPRLLEDVFG